MLDKRIAVIIFIVYFAYFALDVFCAVLLLYNVDRHYDAVAVILLVLSFLHLSFILVGMTGKWIYDKYEKDNTDEKNASKIHTALLSLFAGYDAYPFPSEEEGTRFACKKVLYMMMDWALLFPVALAVAGFGWTAVAEAYHEVFLVTLLILSTIVNAMCFYKFYDVYVHGVANRAIASAAEMVRFELV